MTGPCFRFLWQEPEYSTVDENLVFHLKDDAPEIAKKSGTLTVAEPLI